MEGNAEVAADDQHRHVVTKSETCAEGEVVKEFLNLEFAARKPLVVFSQPYVAGIKEHCPFQALIDVETVFGVKFEYEGACMVEIRGIVVVPSGETSRAYTFDVKTSYRVGATDVELLAIRDIVGVAVGKYGTKSQAGHEPVGFVEALVEHELCLTFNELRHRGSEEVNLVFCATGFEHTVVNVSRLFKGYVPCVSAPFAESTVVGVGVRHSGNELVGETLGEGQVLYQQFGKFVGPVQ